VGKKSQLGHRLATKHMCHELLMICVMLLPADLCSRSFLENFKKQENQSNKQNQRSTKNKTMKKSGLEMLISWNH
jgi:hypothetical protein